MGQLIVDVLQSVAIFLLAGSVKKLSEAILGRNSEKKKEHGQHLHGESTMKEL